MPLVEREMAVVSQYWDADNTDGAQDSCVCLQVWRAQPYLIPHVLAAAALAVSETKFLVKGSQALFVLSFWYEQHLDED